MPQPSPPPQPPRPTPVDTTLLLPLPHDRQLAYATTGPRTSRTALLFFPGIFSIATADPFPEPSPLSNYHYISISLPGWGQSSPRPPHVAYHTSLVADVAALLAHLHPSGLDALYIGGGSFGTAPAQMILGASSEAFPFADKIAGGLLLSGFSPFFYDRGYAAHLTWANWAAVGPPSRLPWHISQRLFIAGMGRKMGSVDGARGFIRRALFDKMTKEERWVMKGWLERRGESEGELVESMAGRAVLSVAGGWEGFMEVSDVLHSDWGFDPRTVERRPVLVVGCEGDELGGGFNAWLGESWGAEVVTVKGGHIGTLFVLEELWERLFEMAGGGRAEQT